jgi:sulfite reductase alpha subunit-like flavoprotein
MGLIMLKPDIQDELENKFIKVVKEKVDMLYWHSSYQEEEFLTTAFIYQTLVWIDMIKSDKHNVFTLYLRDGTRTDYDTNLTVQIWEGNEPELYEKLLTIYNRVKEDKYQNSKKHVINTLQYLEAFKGE